MATQRTSFEPGLAISTVFDQIGPLQEQLAQIAVILEPIQQLSELASVFEPLREFEGRVRDLAKVLAPMHDFQHQLQQVLKQFSSLEMLDQELSQPRTLRTIRIVVLSPRALGRARGYRSTQCAFLGSSGAPSRNPSLAVLSHPCAELRRRRSPNSS